MKLIGSKSCNLFKTVKREERIEHFHLKKPNDTRSNSVLMIIAQIKKHQKEEVDVAQERLND